MKIRQCPNCMYVMSIEHWEVAKYGGKCPGCGGPLHRFMLHGFGVQKEIRNTKGTIIIPGESHE